MIIERFIEWIETAPTDKKAEAADALVKGWLRFDLDQLEQDAAEAAMTCLLDELEDEVRLSLSNALSEHENAPRHIILALAADSSEVSLPVLANSPVLLEGELIRKLETANSEQQMAIASRLNISDALATTLAQIADEMACLVMLMNPSARPSKRAFFNIAERFGDSDEIRKCMLVRHDIGMRARILLIERYAISLITEDDKCNQIELNRSEDEMREICDKAVITFAAQVEDFEILEVAEALIIDQRLTTTFLLRAICMGNLSLFAHALSLLSEQSITRVENVLKGNRQTAFHAIYMRAGLPKSAFDVFASTIANWRQLLTSKEDIDHTQLPYMVTKKVLSAYKGSQDAAVDELLLLLRKICTETARDSARSQVEKINAERARVLSLPPAELSEENLLLFAVHLADELADMAIKDELELNEIAEGLEAANEDLDTIEDEMFNISLELDNEQKVFKRKHHAELLVAA